MLNITGAEARQRALVQSIRFRMKYERAFEKRSVPILDRQARAAAKVFKESDDLIATYIAVDAFAPNWIKLFTAHYGKIGEETGKKYFDDLKSDRTYIETKDFDNFFKDFMRYTGFLGAEQVQLINDTTKGIIKQAVALARELGEGPAEIAKSIYGKVSGIGKINARVRCRLIARTETHGAYNYTNQLAGEHSELDLEKEWNAAEDESTRPDHFEADGQMVNLNESFSVGGVSMMYPGDFGAPPEQVCNCRCSTLQHVKNPKKMFPVAAMPIMR
jgi:hypothetical protein